MPKIQNEKRNLKGLKPGVEKNGIGDSLRDKDKYFWGKSFAEDLNILIKK